MKLNDIQTLFNNHNVKCGSFIGVETTTPVQTNDKDITLVKHSKTVAKIGCEYENLSLTKAAREAGMQKSTKKSNEVWLIDKILSYNTNTEKYKVRFDRIKDQKVYNTFFLVDKLNNRTEITAEHAKSLMKEKKPSAYVNPVWSVCIENIDSLNLDVETD